MKLNNKIMRIWTKGLVIAFVAVSVGFIAGALVLAAASFWESLF